jgi:ribosomal protein S18 acetylase RimI-like enzyme
MAANPNPPEPRLFANYQPRDTHNSRLALPADFVIAPATDADIHAIAAIIMAREGDTIDAALDRARKWLTAPAETHPIFVARTHGAVAAYGRITFTKIAAPDSNVPVGWYLTGVVVDEPFRRQGIARELTRVRLQWVAQRADEVFYFANSTNLASIDLHREFGFKEIRRPFAFPGATFTNGIGVLFRAQLRHSSSP